MKNKNIIIIESNIQNLEILVELLSKNNYNVISVSSEDELKKIEGICELDLALINSNMTFLSPKEIFDLLDKSFEIPPSLLFIDSEKEYSSNLLIECYEMGAVDYIKKPFDLKEILARVNLHANQFLKLNEYRLKIDKLASLATIDQLSKLSSKMHMQAILKHQIALSARYENKFSIFYLRLLDISKFIGIFGYEYGEKFIANFAQELKKYLRETDSIARWAGSDFVILSPHTNKTTSDVIAKKILVELNIIEVMPDVKVDFAIGVTELDDDDCIKSIIQRSKNAMFEASKLEFGKMHRH